MHKGDILPGVLTVLFGALFFIATWSNPKLAFIATTSDGVPGAGFFPFITSLAIILLGILLTVAGIQQRGMVVYVKLTTEIISNLKVLALAVAGLVVFIIAWPLSKSFFICSFILCVYLNKLFRRSWKFTLIYSAAICIFIYLTFVLGFSVQFDI